MKNPFLLISLLSGGISFAQPEQQTVSDYELKGPVKSISTSFSTYSKKPEDRLEMEYGNEFNEQGNVSAWSFWMNFLNLRSNGGYNYDENGVLIEETQADGESSYVKVKYTYNENNTISEMQSLYSDGTLEESTKFTYDEKNQLVEKETFMSDGSSVSSFTYKYDASGNIIEKIEDWDYSKDIYTYKYDADGNEIESHYEQTSIYEDGLAEPLTYLTTYNDAGQWIEITTINAKGKVTNRSTRTFDASGKQTHSHNYNGKGKVTSYTVYTEHDKFGNWLESVTYSGKKISSMESRKITFY